MASPLVKKIMDCILERKNTLCTWHLKVSEQITL
jgi:hypothetical protein